MSLDAAKDAKNQLNKQRKKERERRAKVTTAADLANGGKDGDADDMSEDVAHGQKRKRKQGKEPRAGGAKKRQKTEDDEPESPEPDTNALTAPSYTGPLPVSIPKAKTSKKAGRRDHHGWVLSQSVGGRFLSVDPLFSSDEQFLFLATRRSVLVYSKINSLLYRRIDIDEVHGFVRCLATSPVDPRSLYVGTSSGNLVQLQWHDGVVVGSTQVGSAISAIAVCKDADTNQDIVHFMDSYEGAQKKRASKVCRVLGAQGNVKILLDVSKPLRDFQVTAGGKVMIAASERHIFLGLISGGAGGGQESRSIWHQVESTDPIVSIDARQRTPTSSPGKQSGKGASHAAKVDLAVGSARGPIYVYEDFVSKLTGSGSGKQGVNSTARPVPRILHWHRGPVSSVKWSLDGNYLLSGGLETVLVLWQMKTGKRQDLPHLFSAIDRLSVSPSGTSYGIGLADNSVMVLSTADLLPSAHISGIQSRIASHEGEHIPRIRTVAMIAAEDSDYFRPPAAAIAAMNPVHASQLLIAVPASQPRTEPSNLPRSAPFLQTFDLSSAHNISRQALTRNNVTHVTTGPEANQIGEPDIKFLSISHDGQWLATVEEWLPPNSDLDFTTKDPRILLEERRARLEVYLKFWKWNADDSVWALDTRIDAPHMLRDGFTPARIQCLTADPTSSEFSTSGEDGFVRVWRPKTRFRNEVAVRGQEGVALTIWSCRLAIELESPVIDIEDGIASERLSNTSRVAYSGDGSIIGACCENSFGGVSGVVQLFDSRSGGLAQSRPDLVISGLKDIGFIGRHLVVLSDALIVYDLVDDRLSYQYEIHGPDHSVSTPPQLAINEVSGTFAIAVPRNKEKSRIAVFDPTSPHPVHHSKSDSVISLLSMPKSASYVLLNATAEARTLSLSASVSVPLIKDVAVNGEITFSAMEETAAPTSMVGVGSLEAVDSDMLDAANEHNESEGEGDEDGEEDDDADGSGKPVVRPQQVAALFDANPSFAMPPVKEMFGAILELYGKKYDRGKHGKQAFGSTTMIHREA